MNEKKTNANKVDSIDYIRGIACIIVLISHIISTDKRYGMYVNGCGKIGVWCFFVLSGFLSFYQIIDKKEKLTFKWFLKYYLKKILRLFPQYLIALLITYKLGFINISQVGEHLVCNEGWGHFWYMPVIIKFYIIFPVIALVYKISNEYVVACLVSVAGAILAVIYPFTIYEENSTNIYWYLPILFMGILLCIIYSKTGDKLKDNKYMLICTHIIFIIVVAIMVILTPVLRKILWDIQPTRWLQNKYLLYGFLWTIFILAVVLNKQISNFIEKLKIFKIVGNISFEIYLIHYPVLLKLRSHIENTFIRGVAVIFISIVVSFVINYFIKCIYKLFSHISMKWNNSNC